MPRISRFFLLLTSLLLLSAQTALAQSGGRVILQAPDPSRFPLVALTFEAYDAQGLFLSDLAQNEIEVTENEQPVAIQSLSRLQSGMHIIIAFNAAPTMGTAVGGGANRFEQVKKALLAWIQTQPGNSVDELSLVTNAGPQATRLAGPAQWANALTAYAPDLAKTQSSLTSLTTALDLASDPGRRTNSKCAILYITAPLPDTALPALANLTERAAQLGVHISPWLLPATGDTRSTKPMADLASRTGGQFLNYTGVEILPNPEINFQSLRFQYRLTYPTLARQSGAQRVRVTIRRAGLSAFASQQFTLNFEPPNPFFLSPPSRIQRTWTQPEAPAKPVLVPAEIDLQAIVEFPDGLKRPIKASRLFVDGVQVYEMTADPFNPLVWSLEAYTSSGRHVLRVEMEDSLGFTRSSIETPVEVEVETAPAFRPEDLMAWVMPYLPYAGLVLLGLLALVAIGFGVRALRAGWARRKPGRPLPRRGTTPVPLPAQAGPPVNSNAPARLVRVVEGSFSLSMFSIALGPAETRLGSDPGQVDNPIESPVIDKLHARITHTPEGQFIIWDTGSLAGTWVNYVLVPPQGQVLEHGDWVHLGREAFRFERKPAPAPRQPKIVKVSSPS